MAREWGCITGVWISKTQKGVKRLNYYIQHRHLKTSCTIKQTNCISISLGLITARRMHFLKKHFEVPSHHPVRSHSMIQPIMTHHQYNYGLRSVKTWNLLFSYAYCHNNVKYKVYFYANKKASITTSGPSQLGHLSETFKIQNVHIL